MKGLVLIVLALTFVSCSKDQVNDAKGVFVASVSSAGSSAISTALECSGVDAGRWDNPTTNQQFSDIRFTDARSDGANGSPRTTSETRPKNANVYFVIRVS